MREGGLYVPGDFHDNGKSFKFPFSRQALGNRKTGIYHVHPYGLSVAEAPDTDADKTFFEAIPVLKVLLRFSDRGHRYPPAIITRH